MTKKPARIDLNPSSAARWTGCTASPQFLFDNHHRLPPKGSKFSEEGTTAHELAAALLQNRKPNLEDNYACPVEPNPEMYAHAWNYSEYVEALIEPEGELLVEQKLPLYYQEGRHATVDAAVFNPSNLHIIDYKYGAGVAVSPCESLQAVIYARCVLSGDRTPKSADYPITIHIYQPRGRESGDCPGKTWETTWGTVSRLANEVLRVATEILEKNKTLAFLPSEIACRWCPAKAFCGARKDSLSSKVDELAVLERGPKELPAPQVIPLNQLAAIIEHGDSVKKWINDVQDYALEYMRAGNPIPGAKLVLSREGNRYWTDPDKAAVQLLENTILKESEIYEKKIVSPTAVAKMLGKNKMPASVVNFIDRPPGKPTIALDSDDRESLALSASEDFSPLD